MKNALILDDHYVATLGIRVILENLNPGIAVSGARSVSAGLELLKKNTFDILIMDTSIPGGLDTKMIAVIRNLCPEISILIFSELDEEKYALRYIKAGADGFLSKIKSVMEYKEAVMVLKRKEKYLGSLSKQQLSEMDNKKKMIINSLEKCLSKRETEIAGLMLEGFWTKEIAAILNLRENTISTFKRRIFEKTGVTNLIELSKEYSDYMLSR